MDAELDYPSDPLDFCSLKANWWAFGLRGILAVAFGAIALSMPVTAVLAMTVVFGAYGLVDGIFYLVAGINRARRGRRWGGLVFSGALGCFAGLVVLTVPHLATVSLTFFTWMMISAWALATGLFELAAGLRLRSEIGSEWLMAIVGMLSLALGSWMLVMFLTRPLASLPALGTFIGAYALASGIILLFLAMKLFNLDRQAPTLPMKA